MAMSIGFKLRMMTPCGYASLRGKLREHFVCELSEAIPNTKRHFNRGDCFVVPPYNDDLLLG